VVSVWRKLVFYSFSLFSLFPFVMSLWFACLKSIRIGEILETVKNLPTTRLKEFLNPPLPARSLSQPTAYAPPASRGSSSLSFFLFFFHSLVHSHFFFFLFMRILSFFFSTKSSRSPVLLMFGFMSNKRKSLCEGCPNPPRLFCQPNHQKGLHRTGSIGLHGSLPGVESVPAALVCHWEEWMRLTEWSLCSLRIFSSRC